MKSSPEARAGAKGEGVSSADLFFVNEKNHGWVLEVVKKNTSQSPTQLDDFTSSSVGTVSRSKHQYSYKLRQELDLETPLKHSETHPNSPTPTPTQTNPQQPTTPRGTQPKLTQTQTHPQTHPASHSATNGEEPWRGVERLDHVLDDAELMEQPSLWRMRERMKTVSVALVLCLNLGTDPPDIVKTSPCARMECWMEASELHAENALHQLARNLTTQFERWQPRARYKHALDPTRESVKKLCTSLRRSARRERVLFHYNGHGVPRPTPNGEIWVFNSSYTQYIPLSVYDLIAWTGYPAIYTFDCSGAGLILKHFVQSTTLGVSDGGEAVGSRKWVGSGGEKATAQECIVLAACSANEQLPSSPDFPADVFTSCLTTPIKMALRWFVMQNRTSMNAIGIKPDMVDQIPGRPNDRKTPLGELNWVFTAITDTIAWNVLPRYLFQRLFRQDLLVASLFRNFLLAERILKSVGCTPLTHPTLPATWQHPMWQAWDMAAENCLSQLPLMVPWLFKNNKRKKQLVIPDETVTANEDVSMSSSLPGASSYYGAAKPDRLGELLGKNHTIFSEPATAALSKQAKWNGQHPKDSAAGAVGLSNGHKSNAAEQRTVPSGFVYRNTDFFSHQLTAFEVWLSFADNIEGRAVPEQLPIVLQVLLSQAHRARALDLLANFLDLGLWAVSLALSVGIFPYVNKLLLSPANELKPVLIFIWCKILALDRSCQNDLVKDQAGNDPAKNDGGFRYFITQLIDARPEALLNANADICIRTIYHNVRAAFALSVILDRHALGQTTCLENGLLQVVRPYLSTSLTSTLRSKFVESGCSSASVKGFEGALAQLKRWLCLCLAKLWQDCGAAKRAAFQQGFHLLLYDLVHAKESTDVRQAAIYSLGMLLGPTTTTAQEGDGMSRVKVSEEDDKKDCFIVSKLLDSRRDGSVAVRRELVLALARFVVDNRHATAIQLTAHEIGQEKLRLRKKSVQSMRSSGSALDREADGWMFTEDVFERLQEKLERMLQSNARCYFDTWGCVRQLHEQDPFPAVSMAAGRLVQFVFAGVSKRIEAIRERAGLSESMNKPRVVQKMGGSISVSFSHQQAKQLQRAMLTKRHQPLPSQRRRPTDRARPAPVVPTVDQLRKISLVSLLYAKARKEFMRPTPPHESGPWSRRNATVMPDPLGAVGEQLLTWRQRNAEKAEAARMLRREGKKWAQLGESTPSPLPSALASAGNSRGEQRERVQPVPKPDKHTKRKLVKLSGKASSIPITHGKACNICGRPAVGLSEESSPGFEEFAAIENDSLEVCSNVLFHPYDSYIVVCNQKDVLSVWSYAKDRSRKVKIVLNAEIDEYFHQKAELDDVDRDKDKDKGGWFGSTSATKPSRSLSRQAVTRSKVSDMKWINETAEPFLVVGSDDGIARVWRNILPAADRASEGQRQALGLQERLVSAWVALDVVDSPLGNPPGMVLDWHQRTGQLLCGGPASYVSVWDVEMEIELQRLEVDESAFVTCITSYCQKFGNGGRGVHPSIDSGFGGYAGGGGNALFACGASDGTVRFFDRRVDRLQEVMNTSTVAQLVTTSSEHDSGVASLAIPQRNDGRELVSCSVNGNVKVWDIRSLGSEVDSKDTFAVLNRGQVTAFAAHEYAPIFAAGSSSQSVQVVNSYGLGLSEMRFRESFLRSKSKAVSCLNFHPYRLLLAVGTTDSFASIYAPSMV